ncbi:MAG TPA: membrane bound O-acyl transferase family-domain-containing protein [Polyangiaceae bacterium]|nr:membrane bound O-acyl transferase family-domain-containing protein [Polyangiaceae bacterium]
MSAVNLAPWVLWALACATLSALARPGVGVRAALSLAVLAAPPWAGDLPVVRVAFTVCAVVFVMRAIDWDSLEARSGWERFVWLVLPVVRRIPVSTAARARARGRAWRHLPWALGYLAAWIVLGWAFSHWAQPAPRWAESTMAIFFFVFAFASTAELASAAALTLGADVQPVFDRPLVSRSLREFWSRRWNRFVSRFLLKHVALRLPRGTSPALRTFGVFFVSGLLHEYFAWGAVGSDYPAGWMLGFFCVHGLAVLLEDRLPMAPRTLGIALTFSWMVFTAPAFFHPVATCMPGFGYPSDWIPSAP